MASSNSHDAYSPPPVLVFVGNVLGFLRSEYSQDFSQIAGDKAGFESYRGGLIMLACLIGGFAFLWYFVLVILRCKGRGVGCASGQPFTREKADQRSQAKSTGSLTTTVYDEGQASSTGREDAILDRRLADGFDRPDVSLNSTLPSEGVPHSENLVDEDDALPPEPTPRERRTQLCFLLFGLVTLVSVPFILACSVAPVMDEAAASDVYVQEARNVIDEVDVSFSSISSAGNEVFALMGSLPMNFTQICPGVNSSQLQAVTGFNLEDMIARYSIDYMEIEGELNSQIKNVPSVIDDIGRAVDIVEHAYDEAQHYVWLIPSLLIWLSSMVAIAMFGVFLAWKRESNVRFQFCLSYGLLPFFIFSSVVCWIVAIGAAIAAAMSSDACIAGSSRSPDETVQAILENTGIVPVELQRSIFEYISGCAGESPTTELSNLENQVQAFVDVIWQYLTSVDSVGQEEVDQLCQGGSELQAFLDGLRDIAKLLTAVRKSLDSSVASLRCERINAIYVQLVHQSVCTDVSRSVAWGFIFFLLLAMATLILITLRASWWHEIDEAKIYDESEVAENMIVDEHEEYLAYISKYKHEWEEYCGIDGSLHTDQQPNRFRETEESLPSTYDDGSTAETDSIGADLQGSPAGIVATISYHEAPFNPCTSRPGARSHLTSDFSCLSLRDPSNAVGGQASDDEGGMAISPSCVRSKSNFRAKTAKKLEARSQQPENATNAHFPRTRSERQQIGLPVDSSRGHILDSPLASHKATYHMMPSSQCKRSRIEGQKDVDRHADIMSHSSVRSGQHGVSPSFCQDVQFSLTEDTRSCFTRAEGDIEVDYENGIDLVSTLGKPVRLSLPPRRRASSGLVDRSSADFQIPVDPNPSNVQKQVVADQFADRPVAQASTPPPLLNPSKIKTFAANMNSVAL